MKITNRPLTRKDNGEYSRYRVYEFKSINGTRFELTLDIDSPAIQVFQMTEPDTKEEE